MFSREAFTSMSNAVDELITDTRLPPRTIPWVGENDRDSIIEKTGECRVENRLTLSADNWTEPYTIIRRFLFLSNSSVRYRRIEIIEK